MLDFDFDRMLFKISPEEHGKEDLIRILNEHPEVEFVSYAGIDIAGNDTDERIPVKMFIKDIDAMLKTGVQTDGSSVHLPRIADLNNAKVDMAPDLDVNWYVDYNFDNVSRKTNLPVGTLRIPAFLVHNDRAEVGSRAILRDAVETFKSELLKLLKENPYVFEYIDGVDNVDEIEEILLTSATELEFWVKTPEDKSDKEQLSTSQELKEQYWKRTYGPVRTAMEKSLEILDYYGLNMEMGHKEVGGVSSRLTRTGDYDHVMEQLEIDWKYAGAMQAADNEKHVKYVVRDVFNQFGLQTTFMAKPVEGVAGSGEHTHLGVSAKLKNGKVISMFAAANPLSEFLNPIGFGGILGLLKNYEAINPFVSHSTDALNRLKPGYEAPVCIVTSLGHRPSDPSRNRTILAGLVRDINNPLATRFELRSPNPKSNTYLVIASSYMAMLDGIKAALEAKKTPLELEQSISKKYGEDDFYLDKYREYRSEKNVFLDYTEEERDRLFGHAPRTVWENIEGFNLYPEKTQAISCGGVIPTSALLSFAAYAIGQWATELNDRIIPEYRKIVKSYVAIHDEEASEYDLDNWKEVDDLRRYLAKDSTAEKSLLTKTREALEAEDYPLASKLQLELQEKISLLRDLYIKYKRNLF